MESFKAKLSFEIYYFYASKRTCIFTYTTLDDFSILSTVQQRFLQCYKDVITKLWTLENWTGYDAKWLDLCELSTSETITPVSWDLDSTRYSRDIIGDKRTREAADERHDTEGCLPGFLWTGSPFGEQMNMLQSHLMLYVADRLR